MAKHYKYVNGKRLIVVNNYELGSDVIPDEVNLIPDITQADEGKVLTADENGEPKWTSIPSQFPTLTGNSGKVLKVNSGATGVEWDNESAELPALTDNAGKVLKVNAGATGVEWANETTELPSVTSADEGDVLTVNASGQWAKGTPSGGVTLYGPYKAYNSQSYSITISQGHLTSVYLDYVEDVDGNECDMTDFTSQDVEFFIPVFLNLGSDGKVHLGGLSYPYLEPYDGSYSYNAGSLAVVNDAAFTIGDYQIILGFLSTRELPLAQSEGE